MRRLIGQHLKLKAKNASLTRAPTIFRLRRPETGAISAPNAFGAERSPISKKCLRHSPHGSRARIQHGWDPQHAHLRVSWRSQQPQQRASDRECTRNRAKRGVRHRLLPSSRRALEAHRTGPFDSDHRGQLARSSSTRPPPGSPRPLNRPPTAPWWFVAEAA